MRHSREKNEKNFLNFAFIGKKEWRYRNSKGAVLDRDKIGNQLKIKKKKENCTEDIWEGPVSQNITPF